MANEPTRVGVREARADFPSIVDAAAHGQRFVVTFYGDDRCAVVPMADLERLAQLEARQRTTNTVRGRRG